MYATSEETYYLTKKDLTELRDSVCEVINFLDNDQEKMALVQLGVLLEVLCHHMEENDIYEDEDCSEKECEC